jgi:predicted  nucleic acid-binding Zn-ribbon protein
MGDDIEGGTVLALVESVRCLECGAVYAKPSGGGTVQQNPGCPDCGYLGWLSATVPVSGDLRRRRSALGRRQRLRAQSS